MWRPGLNIFCCNRLGHLSQACLNLYLSVVPSLSNLRQDNEIVTMIENDKPLLTKFHAWQKQEMWTYVTEHCEVGVPCGSGSKGWPYVGPLEAGGAAIVCLDKGILPDNWGVIAPDQVRGGCLIHQDVAACLR